MKLNLLPAAILSICLSGFLLPDLAAERDDSLDGVYSESRVTIDENGKEREVMPWDWAVLELHEGRYRYWHFSDVLVPTKYPLVGNYTKSGDKLIINHADLPGEGERFVFAKVNGVSGLWTEDGLEKWKGGKEVMYPEILVRVSRKTIEDDDPDEGSFVYPKVSALFDRKAVAAHWAQQKKNHRSRYNDIDEPLRSLLRERSREDDGEMLGFKKAIQAHQKKLDPRLVEQLVGNMGRGGRYDIDARMTLDDLFFPGYLLPEKPAFMADNKSRKQALKVLVDAIPAARDDDALSSLLFVFLELSGVHEMDLDLGNGERVELTRRGGTTIQDPFKFSTEAAERCQEWAEGELEKLAD